MDARRGMAKDGPGSLVLAAVAGVAGLLGLELLQTHEVEKRLVVQGQQIRALGEAVERLSATGLRSPSGAGEGLHPEAEAEPDHVLHPEVANFLKPRSRHWPSPGASRNGVLVRGWPSGDPKGFNPIIENSEDIGDIIGPLCGAGIASRDPWKNPNDWNGELATRVEITDDFKEFTVHLRKGVKWQAPLVDVEDPKHAWLKGDHLVTAHDFVFSLDLIMSPQVPNGFMKNYFKELESYRAVDDSTLVVRWKKKEYLNVETTLGMTVVPRFLYAFDEDGTPIPKETLGIRLSQHWYNNKGFLGAGPYRMAAYEPGSKIRLERNEDFFGDKPAIQEIRFLIYTDPNQTLLKLKAHELSTGGLTPGQYREEIQPYEGLQKPPPGSPFFDGRIAHERVPRFAYYYVAWNADRPLFSDKRVRRAMTLALNRKQILESVFAGLGQLITGPYLPESPANDPSVEPIPFDLDAAKKLLAEAGFTDTDGDGLVDGKLHPTDAKRTPFEFTLLLFGSSKEYTALANIFKEDLLKIGVKLNIDAAEWSLMQKRMHEKSFDAYTGGWGMGWEEDLYQIWHSSQADVPQGSNRVGFRNKAADALIEKLRVTFEPGERIALLRAFHRLVSDEQPYTFLLTPRGVFCHWNDVKDIVFPKIAPAINTLPWSVARGAN